MAGYDKTQVFDDSQDLIRKAAECWAVENLGADPTTTSIHELYEPETAKAFSTEIAAWLRVARACVQELEKRGGPRTIAELEKISVEPRFRALY